MFEHLTPERVAKITGGKYIGDDRSRSVHVTGAVRDNRDVSPGNLFVCIRGERADGHDFANSAYKAGASCCLAERLIPGAAGPYVLVDSTLSALKTLAAGYRRQFMIPVVGVTGSVGKTSAKEMTAAVLGEKYRVLKTQENLNNEIGVPLTLLSLDELHEAAVIEMGISDFGEMSRLAAMVRPDICIMTNIGYSHLKELGDLEGVLRAKSEIFAYMNADGAAILNGDDTLLRGYDPGVRKITFGTGPRNDVRAENIRAESTDAVTCDIVSNLARCGDARFSARIPAYGKHLTMAALAAAATGRLLGMTDEETRRGILSYIPTEGRSAVIKTGYLTLINDCYNANPNSVAAALGSLSALPGRRVAILGDMLNLGAQSAALHRETGAFAARSGVSCLISCGEEAGYIREGYLNCGSPGANAAGPVPDAEKTSAHFKTIAELISALPAMLRRDDFVLVKASHSMHFSEIADYIPDRFSADHLA